ncbi:CBS-domain-containing membrane protein [Tritonibacter mobilis]|uniref:HPP family protein n=1 Tax=Tritonibacter mobilis TaxID=379347 RepID=UPI000F6DEDE0|nr:HPP family protein [Tritonibacter mobilis]VCU58225.1 CBS-domain-containing membrane protein [Tritonibacter mobilis]
MQQFLRSLGPAVARVPATEALRAGAGAVVALALIGLLLLSPAVDLQLGLYLVAPFGASSVLLFAVPNSPLAQPWSAIVGNTVAALVGVAVCLSVADPALRVALAVGLAIAATMLCRAVHPPAGAVAMTAAMSPEAVERLGFGFALAPVAVGTVALVILAAAYARLTGRRYPFRQFDDPSPQGTRDRPAQERLGLSQDELSALLDRYRQSFNLGVEDLARLISAAELQAATHDSGAIAAQDLMSRDLITVSPAARLSEVADLFAQHRITSIPVVGEGERYLGVIFQLHLITRARGEALVPEGGYIAALRHLLAGGRKGRMGRLRAADIMDASSPYVSPDAPVAQLLPMMADGEVDAVPVLDEERLVGIVTGTDLIAALAHKSLSDQSAV